MELTEKDKERFWSKVDKGSCWIWTACCNKNGYGQIKINCKRYLSHRISWFLAGNTIPEGHLIRHKCRNRNCVNPEHLETGTQADNEADKIRDGTDCRGEKCYNAKLTSTQVLDIRARAEGKHIELAKEYGVSRPTIHSIIARKTWKHL
jgi:hypothetical protein